MSFIVEEEEQIFKSLAVFKSLALESPFVWMVPQLPLDSLSSDLTLWKGTGWYFVWYPLTGVCLELLMVDFRRHPTGQQCAPLTAFANDFHACHCPLWPALDHLAHSHFSSPPSHMQVTAERWGAPCKVSLNCSASFLFLPPPSAHDPSGPPPVAPALGISTRQRFLYFALPPHFLLLPCVSLTHPFECPTVGTGPAFGPKVRPGWCHSRSRYQPLYSSLSAWSSGGGALSRSALSRLNEYLLTGLISLMKSFRELRRVILELSASIWYVMVGGSPMPYSGSQVDGGFKIGPFSKSTGNLKRY